MKRIKIQKNKLVAKITTIIFLMVIVPLAVLGGYGYYLESGSTKELLSKELHILDVSHELLLIEHVKARMTRVSDFASDGKIRDYFLSNGSKSHHEQINHLLSYKKSLDEGIVAVALLGLNGNFVMSTDGELLGENYKNKKLFDGASEKAKISHVIYLEHLHPQTR